MVAVFETRKMDELDEFKEFEEIEECEEDDDEDWGELGRETRERSFYLSNFEEIKVIERFIIGSHFSLPRQSLAGNVGNS